MQLLDDDDDVSVLEDEDELSVAQEDAPVRPNSSAITGHKGRNRPYTYTLDEELSLLEKAQSGDRDAQNALILAEIPSINDQAKRVSSRYENVDSDDLAQDVLEKFLTFDLKKYTPMPGKRLRNYIMTSVKNMAVTLYRDTETRKTDSLDRPVKKQDNTEGTTLGDLFESSLPGPEQCAAENEFLTILSSALERLPERQKQVMAEVIEETMSKDIAAMMGISEGSVKTHSSRARKFISKALKAGIGGVPKAQISPEQQAFCVAARSGLSPQDHFLFSSVFLPDEGKPFEVEDLALALNINAGEVKERLPKILSRVLKIVPEEYAATPLAEKMAHIANHTEAGPAHIAGASALDHILALTLPDAPADLTDSPLGITRNHAHENRLDEHLSRLDMDCPEIALTAISASIALPPERFLPFLQTRLYKPEFRTTPEDQARAQNTYIRTTADDIARSCHALKVMLAESFPFAKTFAPLKMLLPYNQGLDPDLDLSRIDFKKDAAKETIFELAQQSLSSLSLYWFSATELYAGSCSKTVRRKSLAEEFGVADKFIATALRNSKNVLREQAQASHPELLSHPALK